MYTCNNTKAYARDNMLLEPNWVIMLTCVSLNSISRQSISRAQTIHIWDLFCIIWSRVPEARFTIILKFFFYSPVIHHCEGGKIYSRDATPVWLASSSCHDLFPEGHPVISGLRGLSHAHIEYGTLEGSTLSGKTHSLNHACRFQTSKDRKVQKKNSSQPA